MNPYASLQITPHPSDRGVAGNEERPTSSINLRIAGMTCPHCSPTIDKALRAIEGVTAALVTRKR